MYMRYKQRKEEAVAKIEQSQKEMKNIFPLIKNNKEEKKHSGCNCSRNK